MNGLDLLSEVIVYSKYAKYKPELKRRETWNEIVYRYLGMLADKYPELSDDIYRNGEYIFDKKILPSMRALQFSGEAIKKNPIRLYNCSFLPIDDILAFNEVMFLLLSGVGVGYSVQFHHIDKLPEIIKPIKEKRYLIGDSLEGWADSIKILIKSYFGKQNWKPRFDYSDIRPKGTRLVTAGGKAPGPEPLKICHVHIEAILERFSNGQKIRPIDAHDIICHIANAVLAGGIRRSATISLFSFDDEEMISCKHGNWWELNEQRGRANNSAVVDRKRIKYDEFKSFFKKIELSNAGEPGIFLTNNIEWGLNPCAEIALRPFQTCNLCEINADDIDTQKELNKRAEIASFFGTLQAGFTDFHYLRDIWKKTVEKDALLGIGMTGIGSNKVTKLNLEQAANIAKNVNNEISQIISINKAARVTCIKPAGTTSCVLKCSSGIHAWYNDYYIRRIRLGKDESMYRYLNTLMPELMEDDYFRPTIQAVFSFPIAAPKGSIYRTESAIDTLERVKDFMINWVFPGHRNGDNLHNVSCTINIKPEEWDIVRDWIWTNKNDCTGISLLPYDNGSYIQAPFEDISKEKYEELIKYVKNIDLSEIIEEEDYTDLKGEAACAGGVCEIQSI